MQLDSSATVPSPRTTWSVAATIARRVVRVRWTTAPHVPSASWWTVRSEPSGRCAPTRGSFDASWLRTRALTADTSWIGASPSTSVTARSIAAIAGRASETSRRATSSTVVPPGDRHRTVLARTPLRRSSDRS